MKHIHLEVPDEIHKQLRQTALAQDQTMHDMAVRIIKAYMVGVCEECGLRTDECGDSV